MVVGSKGTGSKWGALAVGLSLLAQAGCSSLMVKRDLSRTKPGVVVYDDMCGLQDYFDGMKDSTIATPREIFGQDLSADENGQASGGRARFRYETEFQRHHLRKLLATNWASIPAEIEKADAIDLEVRWSKRAGVKRVVTEESAVVAVGPKSWELPYQVCLSDFVYGEDLYNTRRMVLQLPAPPRSPFSKRAAEKAAVVAAAVPVATTPAADGVPPGAALVPVALAPAGLAPAPAPEALAPAPAGVVPAPAAAPVAPPANPAAAPAPSTH